MIRAVTVAESLDPIRSISVSPCPTSCGRSTRMSESAAQSISTRCRL